MDKKTFDLIREYYNAEIEIFFKLTKGVLGLDEVEVLIEPLVDLREKSLRIGKYTVEEEVLNIDTYITAEYEGLPRYTKLNVIYNYDDNGMSLCVTTSELYYLVPNELLAN